MIRFSIYHNPWESTIQEAQAKQAIEIMITAIRLAPIQVFHAVPSAFFSAAAELATPVSIGGLCHMPSFDLSPWSLQAQTSSPP
jgi:hypothetical protein